MQQREEKINNVHVSLRQAIYWIARGSFEAPSLDGWIQHVDPLKISKEDKALVQLSAAILSGEIEAQGFLSTEPLDGKRGPAANLHTWPSRQYINHDRQRSKIPPMTWSKSHVDWIACTSKTFDREYAAVELSQGQLLALWPRRSDVRIMERSSAGHWPGRPARFDEREFLALCVVEASEKGLPETQAEFISRMTDAASSMWGEENTPGETWLKEKVSNIYKLKARYKSR